MAVNLDLVGKELGEKTFTYGWKDVALYALGVGAGPEDLDFVFEMADLKTLPTFAVVPAYAPVFEVVSQAGVNPVGLVHGEQKITVHKPIPTEGTLTTRFRVPGIYDKVKSALVFVETKSYDAKNELVCETLWSLFCRGEGGFGGERGPDAKKVEPPARPADWRAEYQTQPSQALLFRLSGDLNPLHASPQFAEMAGFPKPILHGLCTYGFAGRAALQHACGNDPRRFRSFTTRFTDVVYPGDTLVVEGWKLDGGVHAMRVQTGDGRTVLGNASCETVS